MSIDTAAAEHACNVVRRHIQEEFPGLALTFVVHKRGGLKKALSKKREEVATHPAGSLLLPAIEKAARTEASPGRFCGIARAKEKKMVPLLAREKTLACFFVCADDLLDPEDAKEQVYALSWRALSVFNEGEAPNLFVPDEDEVTAAWRNMLGEAFSALTIEMHGKKGFIRALAKKRSAMTLTATPGYRAENYPFPIVLDATLLVYDDMKKEGLTSKARPLAQALAMTAEIGTTFDSSSVLHWWAFSKPAQDMAWLNIDKNKILGAAVHTSEDPYARSTAYLVAEALNIDPAPLSDISLYNPFTDQEANERHHRKICEEIFENIADKIAGQESGDLFRAEAAKRTKKLLEGQLIGWCSPALLAAAEAYDRSASLEAASKAFRDSAALIGAETLRKFSQVIIQLRRAGDKVTPQVLASHARDDEDLRATAQGLLAGAA